MWYNIRMGLRFHLTRFQKKKQDVRAYAGAGKRQNPGKGNATMRLYVIRHGETAYNERSLLQGQTDSELNDMGRRLAELTGDALKREGACPYRSAPSAG